MSLDDFIKKLASTPKQVSFAETIQVINDYYDYKPAAFVNGDLANAAGENEGSCKIFAFAELHKLDKETTLQCFGDYYRKDVLDAPDGDSHQNIRNFMQYGWDGISFTSSALGAKSSN